MAAPLFPLDRIVATPGALNALVMDRQDPGELLERHQAGDWAMCHPLILPRIGAASGTAGAS